MFEIASLPKEHTFRNLLMRSAAFFSLAGAIMLLAACGVMNDTSSPPAASAAAAAPANPAPTTQNAPPVNPAEPDGDEVAGTKAATEPTGPGTPVNMSADTSLGSDINGLIGDKIATILAGGDRQVAAMAAAQAAALPNGHKVTWQGSTNTTQSPATGWASPVGGAYTDAAGRSCRFVWQSASHGSDQASETVKLCNGPGGWVPA